MGKRPGACDFGLYGQLTQLALFDPTTAAITVAEAPRIYCWTENTEDLSGLDASEDDWIASRSRQTTFGYGAARRCSRMDPSPSDRVRSYGGFALIRGATAVFESVNFLCQ